MKKIILEQQDTRLVEAATKLAETVRALPSDPKYPNIQPRALLVGGFVRDAMLGLHPKDADLEIYGVSPERLESLLEQMYSGKVDAVGRSFGILKIHLAADLEFDVSIPRRESKQGTGHKGFVVESDPGMSIEDAARRRDFTVNAICADPLTGEVFDAFGGLEDLEHKILRVADAERFQDDPLRVYRAVQFSARLGFSVEPKSFELMREMVERGDLRELSKERVSEEIKKLLLKSERPSVGFWLMRELGIIARDYPELHALIGTMQELEWHPEGDVWIHTLMVMDQAALIIRRETSHLSDEEKLQVMLSALCHDLGKPSTTKMGEKAGVMRLRSLGHEEAGEEPTKMLFNRWAFSHDVEIASIAATTQHLKPSMLYLQKAKGTLSEEQYVNALRKLVKRIYPVSWRVLIAVAEADFRGRAIPGADTDPYLYGADFEKTILANHLDEEPTKPLIQGRDLLDRGVKPGKKMGEVIREIEHLRDEGKIKTREEALARLDHLLAS